MNTDGLPLFERALARNTDPETSHDAARKVDVQRTEGFVLAALKTAPGGLTTHEIEDLTGLAAGSVTPRMKPLEKKELVVRTEERRVPHGHRRQQIVWRLLSHSSRT